MRRTSLLFLGSLAICANMAAAPLFSTQLNTQEEFDLWKVVDNNEDGATWVFSPTNSDRERTYYSYNGTNDADDWLISPAITPSQDGPYIVKYIFKGSSYTESMKVYMADAPTVEALSANLKGDYPEVMANDYEGYFLFDGQAGEPVYLGFQACTKANRWRLYLKEVIVEPCDNPTDLAVTGFISPVSAEGLTTAEQVTIEVKNAGMTTIESFSVTMSVNGEAIFTEPVEKTLLPGESAEITLAGTVDLSTSHSTYTLSATAAVEGDISEGNNTFTANVRHIGPAVEPYTMGFEPLEDTSDIKFFDLNQDSGNWGIEIGSFFMNLARTGVGCLGYNYDRDNNADDWAILDGVKVDAGHHVLKFWLSGDDSHPERLSVHYGNEATPEGMTHELIRFDPFQQGEYQEVICIFELEEPQTIYIGFHAFSDKDENWITIDDVSLDKISSTEADLIIESLNAPGAYIPTYESRDVVFTVRNVGIIDVPSTASLYIDDVLAASSELTVKAQEIREIAFTEGLAGISEGSHNIKVEITSPLDTHPENNAIASEVRILPAPAIIYDFEEDEQALELTLRSEDNNQLYNDEFGESGWGLMGIKEHPKYGLQMLGVYVAFTDPKAQADRWLVLPQLVVNSDDACFVWNAGAVNTYEGTEAYRAMVSTGDDKWSDYSTALDVPVESTLRTTRGIDLGAYNGKEIYVALNIRSVNGNILTLDNLELHGCSLKQSGISNVTSDDSTLAMTVSGDLLLVNGSDDVKVEVYDLTGKLVLVAESTTVDLSGLAAGIYVARATDANACATIKLTRN